MKKPQNNKKTASTEDDLLEKLEGTTPLVLRNSVAKVEGISKDDEEKHSLWLKSVRNKTVTKLTSWFLHFMFLVTCGIVLFLVGGTFWLSGIWVSSFVDKPDMIGTLLGRFWEIGLIALATLFIQNAWPRG